MNAHAGFHKGFTGKCESGRGFYFPEWLVFIPVYCMLYGYFLIYIVIELFTIVKIKETQEREPIPALSPPPPRPGKTDSALSIKKQSKQKAVP